MDIDGFAVDAPEGEGAGVLYMFNDWTGKPEGEVKYPMIPPRRVSAKNVRGARSVALCQNPALLRETEFAAED